jgi:hypothetical protein
VQRQLVAANSLAQRAALSRLQGFNSCTPPEYNISRGACQAPFTYPFIIRLLNNPQGHWPEIWVILKEAVMSMNRLTDVLHRIRAKPYPNFLPHIEGAYFAKTAEKTLSVEDVRTTRIIKPLVHRLHGLKRMSCTEICAAIWRNLRNLWIRGYCLRSPSGTAQEGVHRLR